MSVPRPGSWLTRTAVLLGLAVSGVATAQDRVLTPVTDEMLEHPDPADWLHWRRSSMAGAIAPSTRFIVGTRIGCSWCGHGHCRPA
jgi:hypothetical protein